MIHILLSPILAPLAFVYALMSLFRNFLYNINFLKSLKLSAYTISVGNLTLGGTGKTPYTIFLVNKLISEGKSVVVVSRGYKGSASGVTEVKSTSLPSFVGDEPLEVKKKTAARVFVGPSKSETARFVDETYSPDVIVVDDGFQHRRLKRDEDIVLIDASKPSWEYFVFPFGRGREPFLGLRRATKVIITRIDSSHSSFSVIRSKIRQFGLHSVDFEMKFSLSSALIEQIKGKRVLVVSGIGNPVAFERMIRKDLKPSEIVSKRYADHYHYTERDIKEISQIRNEQNCDFILVTSKDAVKLESASLNNMIEIPLRTTIEES